MDAFQYLFSLEKFGIKFGLASIRALCTALGEPQNAFRSVLIAGTNGKGSVTAMVDCGLRAAGLKVGRYTSPHLIHLEERFVLNGLPVDTAALADSIGRVRACQIGSFLPSATARLTIRSIASPFSACTITSAPVSAAVSIVLKSVSSSTMTAPL